MNKLDLNVSKDYKMNNLQDLLFCELINVKKLEYLLANEKYYNEYFEEERNKLKIKFKESKYEYNVFALIRKILKNIIKIDNSDYGYLPVSYKKANGINYGRWYAKNSLGLQSMLGSIRHTICTTKWIDIDQVNSHLVILQQLFTKNNIDCDILNYIIANREEYLQSIMDELSISRSEAKRIIIAVMNGGSTYKSKIVADFKDKVFEHIKTICLLPEFNYILEDTLKKSEKEKSFNLYGKCISKILQVIENNLLEHYVKFCIDKNYIPKVILNGKEYFHTSLIFDGLQTPYHPDIVSNNTILNECQAYTFEHTGYNVDIVIKPFDNALELPDNYKDILDDIPAIINNLRTGLEHFKNKYRKKIDKANDSLTHYDTAVIFSLMLKDKVYCEDDKNWYYCNPYNNWKYNSSPMILEAIVPVIGTELLELISKEYVAKAMDTSLEKEERDKFLKKAEKVEKLINSLKLTPFRNNVIKGNYSLYIKENFKEKYLDSKTHIFAFSNKVFDFSLNPDKKREDLTINDFIRYIKPNDYIFTNTGYNFPEECEDSYTTKLNTYFVDLFPVIEIQDDDDDKKIITLNEDKKDYVLNMISTSLNGSNNEQSVMFHTGRGSNSKTTLFSLIETVFGDYFISLNAETFTEKMRANACNDLWKLKGKRFTTFQEPDDTNGTELQASTLKVFGDNASVKLNGNQKYKDPIQFVNQSTLHGAMNKKPALSGIDGGIKRRVKIIEYTTQFVETVRDTNYERLINPDFMKEVSSIEMRDAFVIMLLENWIKNVRDHKIITVPNCVIEASAEYCDGCDVVKQFLYDGYITTHNGKDRIKSNDLYAKFKQYIKDNGIEKTLSDKKFKESMLDIRDITLKRSNGSFYCGLVEKESRSEDTESPVPVKGPDVEFRPDTDDETETNTRCESPEPCK
jgi:P4 family phage/plasmid primase-like protien